MVSESGSNDRKSRKVGLSAGAAGLGVDYDAQLHDVSSRDR
jgi:hypothetical protein